MNRGETALNRIRTILDSSNDRQTKAEKTAEAIRLFGRYRRVAIYDVNEIEIGVIARAAMGHLNTCASPL